MKNLSKDSYKGKHASHRMTEKFCNSYAFNKGQEFLQINKEKIRQPSRKTGIRSEQYFTKEDIQVATGHMKRSYIH